MNILRELEVRFRLSRFILIGALLWTFYLVNGQNEAYINPIIKHYSLKDGLSQVSSNDLIRDKNGFVWIATQDGLNRFDGSEFIHFKNSTTDSLSISGNLINKLCEDTEGRIWVGTMGNGLCYYESE